MTLDEFLYHCGPGLTKLLRIIRVRPAKADDAGADKPDRKAFQQ